VLLISIALGVTPGALAQDAGPLQLVWRAPAGCPSGTQVQSRIRKLVMADAAASAPPLRAEATIARQPDGTLQLKLVVRESDLVGERTVAGRTCEDVTNAAVIHLALLMRGGASLGPGSSPSPSPARSTAAVLAPAAQSSRPVPAASPDRAADSSSRAQPEAASRPLPIALQLPLALLGLGELPRPALGLGVAAGVRLGRWQLLIDARAWRPQRSPRDETAAGADLQRAALGVRACRALTAGVFELSPCLRASVQQLWAHGTGPHVASRSARQTWAAVALGLQGRLQWLSWLGVVAQLEVQVGTARPRLVLEGEGELERLGPASMVFGLGVEWIL
jgi:hypothetical protein